jgi:hypothetical protein
MLNSFTIKWNTLMTAKAKHLDSAPASPATSFLVSVTLIMPRYTDTLGFDYFLVVVSRIVCCMSLW